MRAPEVGLALVSVDEKGGPCLEAGKRGQYTMSAPWTEGAGFPDRQRGPPAK